MENLSIELLDKKFETSLPSIGQLMEIESLKQTLTNGTYSQMVQSRNVVSVFNLDLVDAVSHFSILSVGFKERVSLIAENNGSVLDLPAMYAKKIVKAYKSQFKPWYSKFQEELYSDIETKKEDDPN